MVYLELFLEVKDFLTMLALKLDSLAALGVDLQVRILVESKCTVGTPEWSFSWQKTG